MWEIQYDSLYRDVFLEKYLVLALERSQEWESQVSCCAGAEKQNLSGNFLKPEMKVEVGYYQFCPPGDWSSSLMRNNLIME